MRTFWIPWRPLWLAAGLLSGLGAVAQVITVPSQCTVVEPGVGGNAALHQVGPDGVITMPDNFDPGAAFTFSAGTPQYWQVWGDLSLSSTGFLRSVFSVNPATIRSYNFDP
ncbi:MAG TPA: hypothetical protein VHL57_00135, partial [Flavobacteriales bacterium]|nr:hypothetical protein [Flavobacteriales bacterium]